MTSTQEAEQFIQSLSGYSTLRRDYVEKSSKRLLFELLRHINGKTFATAEAAKATPFLTLKVYPGRIIAECNSDDLTKEDLQAICQSVDKEQTKAVNFKTIVAATKRTHIQSGNFSFEFQHNIFDLDNNHIMRPVWVTPAQTVAVGTTRITLYLHDQGSKDEIQYLRNIIVSQFEGLRQESILFLNNIQSLKVESREDDRMLRSRHFEKQTVDEYRVSVKVTTVDGERSEEDTRTHLFHLTKSDDPATNLILAFPLTDDFKAEVGSTSTKIFNLLPLTQGSLGFHINSLLDVDDQNGAIIVSTNNIGIRNEIANLFFNVILQFCEHPFLRYQWPLFLKAGVAEEDPFWSLLRSDIRNWISQNPVFVSRHVKHWRLISHLAAPGWDTQDEAGNPLLDDEINDPFLSSRYPPGVTGILRCYGLAALSNAQCVELLKKHFNNPSLEYRTMIRTKEWYSALTRLISKLLNNSEHSDTIKSFPSLILRYGTTVSAASAVSQPVYFPTTNNIEIPKTLTLRVIKDTEGDRKYPTALYKQLGVTEASVAQVRTLIMEALSASNSFTLDEIKSYLRYLYLTHHQKPCSPPHEELYSAVKIITQDMKTKSLRDSTIYLPGTEHPYTTQSLLGSGIFGLSEPIDYLHPSLLKDAPKNPEVGHIAWKTWLCDCLGMKERLSLFRSIPCHERDSTRGALSAPETSDSLSEHCTYLLKNRPDVFLGLLEHLWGFEGFRIMESPALLSEIRRLPAKSLCGLDRLVVLRDTWVPIQGLKEHVKTFMDYPDMFPFLKLENGIDTNLALPGNKWWFLTRDLGVKRDYGMDFLLAILDSIVQSCKTLLSSQMVKVFNLYYSIRTTFSSCNDGEKQRALEFFENSGILYMDESGPIWTGTSSCLWTAPPDMISRYSLKMFYEDKVIDKDTLQGISDLFCKVLGIQDATAEDVVEEMCLLRDEGCEDLARITNNYAYLDNSIESSCSIRTAFGEQAVIFIQHDDISTWFSVKECFWSDAETTPKECCLKRCYPGFKSFFLEKLGVRTSSYDKLVNFTSTDVKEAKKCLLSFMDESDTIFEYEPEPMAKVKIFPVQYPTSEAQPRPRIELCSLDTEFCIGDREYLVKSLQPQVKMLSFSITEIRKLQLFFSWLSMEDRYLSECVEETMTDFPSSNFMPRDATAIEMALMNKAYHIARVAETFKSYGPYGNALSLYIMLRKMKIAKVDNMSIDLLLCQDDEVFMSRSSEKTIAYISEHIDSMAIYVNYDDSDEQLCLFSTLPRKLQQWLMQDLRKLFFEPFEVTNALTSIFACDADILDDILHDQGMAELPFENLDKVQSKPYTGAQQPRVDQDKPFTMPIQSKDRPDHIYWQCVPDIKPSLIDKVRGKKPCQRQNSMRYDICSGCCTKRRAGAIAKNRDSETIGELLTWDVHGNEIWRYTVPYPGPQKYEFWAEDFP
ncbi:unnamed protein product [Fusarium graminearum]|nr:unnamed protein product [Fusarium graminearum]